MTKQELLEKLKQIEDERDIEERHRLADAALLDYIKDAEISAAFDAIDKWYA